MPMHYEESIQTAADRAAELLSDDLPILVLTGAGVSVESNIPPFRGEGGLWDRYDPYEYGHIDTFRVHPERSWEMLREIIEGSMRSMPNEAHRALARMEGKGWIGPVVTQNVDGLHAMAGTRDLIELHGNARRIYCMDCGRKEVLDPSTWSGFSIKCRCSSIKRPDIVFFGEMLPEDALGRAVETASKGPNILVIGTSGIVHPAASIPIIAKANGGLLVEINSQPSEFTGTLTDVFINGPATLGARALEDAIQRFFDTSS
ncbi:MAG: Sir2 family NAD-dependent protein deacetylase [Thermoplasmatota archaeon]